MSYDFGPLRSLIESDDITEIMVNGWDKIYVEHRGLLVQTAAKFVDSRQLSELIYSILAADNKTLSSQLFFDGTLRNGFRYNITLPPMSPKGPSLTIRKFSLKNFSFDDLLSSNFFSKPCAQFLMHAVKARANIIVSGGTGTGKTSFLNCLAHYISADERVVSIEDVAELRLQHPNWIALQAVRTAEQSVTVRDCLVSSLRMRPNRIIVGECRKDETFEMLQAMNSGHEGSMTTVHANSSSDCLSRLELLILTTGLDLPVAQIRYQMSRAINLVIQLQRRPSGQRIISEVMEITGIDGHVISRSTIFERERQGQLVTTNYVPDFLSRINKDSVVLPAHTFAFKKAS
jgi:pilus assembly protein CpaF